jgi:hypothetical protein
MTPGFFWLAGLAAITAIAVILEILRLRRRWRRPSSDGRPLLALRTVASAIRADANNYARELGNGASLEHWASVVVEAVASADRHRSRLIEVRDSGGMYSVVRFQVDRVLADLQTIRRVSTTAPAREGGPEGTESPTTRPNLRERYIQSLKALGESAEELERSISAAYELHAQACGSAIKLDVA